MLMVMTFNVWVLIAVVVGAVLGRLICHAATGGHAMYLTLSGRKIEDEVAEEEELWTRKQNNNNKTAQSVESVQLVSSM